MLPVNFDEQWKTATGAWIPKLGLLLFPRLEIKTATWILLSKYEKHRICQVFNQECNTETIHVLDNVCVIYTIRWLFTLG